MFGRKLLYPRDFGYVTAGSSNTTAIGVIYNALRIQGYNYGAKGYQKFFLPHQTTAFFQM
jgi:hypothetical protein